jgi:hypothetical protein
MICSITIIFCEEEVNIIKFFESLGDVEKSAQVLIC